MAWRTHIHMGVMQHEVFHVHEFAVHPHGGDGVGEILPFDEALFHRRSAYPLVQPRQRFARAGGSDEELFELDVGYVVNH